MADVQCIFFLNTGKMSSDGWLTLKSLQQVFKFVIPITEALFKRE